MAKPALLPSLTCPIINHSAFIPPSRMSFLSS
eukprot:CAMPEP_0117649696 /NCGR_PEP_ID=MMETSP0804-20121206/1120_1 /TAXON_ID=1074897 /ORGANISM="Tetraselmis astigmatica, Strain CCMP880" /LENGTH=31 /DNA_ID= /DNA_START= /DNA_END= /DNA_ORIENTATION=